METDNNGLENILKIMLKELYLSHTISSLAQKLKMSRVGVWKILKRLKANKFIILSPISKGKTSAHIIKLNWENILVEKKLAFLLFEDAIKQERWRFNFAELEKHVSFLLLFGSILYSPKDARDIDILVVLNNKKEFKVIDETVLKIQRVQLKKIHCIDLTENELGQELKNKNKAYIDALSKGVIIFGQENFVKFIKKLQKNEI
ncbi:HTH domain-containing protein [Candidatus Pacearchaeota archaeon]|nr:HTH domain-containing protein [Candidatus Pacearchaeota archaeon]